MRRRALSDPRPQAGVSLLIWIGVLAVVAILLAFLLPALVRESDFSVARQESALLKTFGNALQAAAQRHGYIPSQTDWATNVAAEAGLDIATVATNPRHQARLLLIDTNGWFGSVSLPYTQTYAGTTNLPSNARMMIVSSLGVPLPVSLTSGPLSATNFSSLWMAAEGTASFPTAGPWSGWNGRSDDVKIERVHLSPLFVSLYLATYRSEPFAGQYSIGTDPTNYAAPYESDHYAPPPSYYLMGTAVYLYNTATNGVTTLDSTQILIRDGSFLYQNGTWKSSSAGGYMPGGVDIAGVVAAFLNSVPNTQARNGAAEQQLVVQSMMDYMSNYVAWAQGGFTDPNLKSYLLTVAQPNLISTCQDLFQGAYYPTNATGPQ